MKRTQSMIDLCALYLKRLNEENTGYITDEENEVKEVETLCADKETALAPQTRGTM